LSQIIRSQFMAGVKRAVCELNTIGREPKTHGLLPDCPQAALGPVAVPIGDQRPKTNLQMNTAAIKLTMSAKRPETTACRAFLMPTAPKYTART
jgi:hypothetical protein